MNIDDNSIVKLYSLQKGDVFRLRTDFYMNNIQVLFWLIKNCKIKRQYKTSYIYYFKFFRRYKQINSIFKKINWTEFEVIKGDN